MSNKNIVELTDKQCIAIFEFCTKADMVAYDEVTPTEVGKIILQLLYSYEKLQAE